MFLCNFQICSFIVFYLFFILSICCCSNALGLTVYGKSKLGNWRKEKLTHDCKKTENSGINFGFVFFPKFESNRGLSYVIRCGRIFGYSHSLSAYVNKKYRHRVLLLNAIPCAVFRALLFVIFFRNDRMIYSRISP